MTRTFRTLALIAGLALAAAASAAAGFDLSQLPPEVAIGLAGAGVGLSTNFVQAGKVIDWTNGTGAAVASGDVVKIGNLLGVAAVDIAADASGSVSLCGVFTVPKVAGAVIAQGETLTWDASAAAFDDNAAVAAAGDITGAAAVAFEAAGNGVTELDVLFTGTPGTLTA